MMDQVELPVHKMEEYVLPEQLAKCSFHCYLVHAIFIYVDNYIAAAVESANGTLLGCLGRAALHSIHSIFPPLLVTGHVDGKDLILVKKLRKDNGRWHWEKEIPGFVVDGNKKTVRITADKVEAIVSEIRKILKKKKVQIKCYQTLLGKLQHVAIILPSACRLFSPLNKALRNNPKSIGLGKGSKI